MKKIIDPLYGDIRYRYRSRYVPPSRRGTASRTRATPFFLLHGDSEGSPRVIIFPIRSEVLPVSVPLPPSQATPPRYMHPAVPALALNRAPSHHRLACIPTPKAGGWHVAHYVICPLDQSTGGAHFFPASKKKRRKGRKRQRNTRERTRRTGRESEDARRKETPTAGGRPRGEGGERERFGITPEARCGPIAIRKEAFFMGAARSAGLCDKN